MPPTLMTQILMTMLMLMPPMLLTMIIYIQTKKNPNIHLETQSIFQKLPQHQKIFKNITDAPDGDAKIADLR